MAIHDVRPPGDPWLRPFRSGLFRTTSGPLGLDLSCHARARPIDRDGSMAPDGLWARDPWLRGVARLATCRPLGWSRRRSAAPALARLSRDLARCGGGGSDDGPGNAG